MTQLQPNFSVAEMMTGEQYLKFGELSEYHRDNLRRVAFVLQVLRGIWGKRIIITSGYRSRKTNQEIYKELDIPEKTGSYHLLGLAVDIVVEGMSPKQVQRYLDTVNWPGGLGYGDTFTHIDLGPRRRWNY